MAELWRHADRWMPWLVTSSVQAAVLVAMVLAAQWLLRRWLPARWRHALWLLVLVRLVLPAAPRTDWSPSNLLVLQWAPAEAGSGPGPEPHTPIDAGPAPSVSTAALPVGAPVDPAPPPQAAGETKRVAATAAAPVRTEPEELLRPAAPAAPWQDHALGALSLLWAVVAAGLLARLVAANVRFHRRLRRDSHPAGPELGAFVRQCAGQMRLRRPVAVLLTSAVEGPALFGLLRPTLLLPDGLDEQLDREQLRHVLLHELAHLRRRDVPLDWLATVLTALHWFNPMLWLALARMRADRELACDEAVLGRTGAPAAREYGQTMLKLVERLGTPGRVAGIVGVLEKANQVTRRIQMIASFTQRGRRWSVVGIVLLAGLGAVSLTDARGQRSEAAKPAAKAPATGEAVAQPAAETSPAAPPKKPSSTTPARKPTDPNAALRKALARNVERLSFVDVSLKDVIQFLRQHSGANIFVHWRALAAAGVRPDAKLSADARDISVQRALEMVLRDVSGRHIGTSLEVASAPAGGVLVITVKRNLRELGRGACGEVRPWNAKATVADTALRKKLTKRIERLSFADIDLKDVFQFLREYSEANIHASWPSLGRIKIQPDTKISLDLRDVSVEQALQLALLAAGPYASSGGTAAYAIEDGVLTVAAHEELRRRRASAFGAAWYSAVTALPADHTRTLAFVQAGRVAKVAVKAGDAVKAGQELVRLDDAAERAELAELKADAANDIRVRAAEAQFEQKRTDLKRVEALFKTGAITTEECQRARLDVQVAELSVALAKTELEEARHKLRQAEIQVERMRLVSPIAGRVERVYAGVGEAVAALAPVVRVVKTGSDPLVADVNVPTAVAVKLKPGQAALAQIDDAESVLRGKIARIATTADPAGRTLTIYVVLPNPTNRPAGENIIVSFP